VAKSVLAAPHFQDEAAAFAYVEAHLWPNGPVCPFCGETVRIGKLNGKTTRPGLHKCYACKRPFTVRIGTIFESSHLALRLWLQVIHLMCASKKGVATRQIQRMMNCSMKTAWFVGHRVREAMAQNKRVQMGGSGKVVEADETYIGRKAGETIRRGGQHKMAVVSLVERGGEVPSFHLEKANASKIAEIVRREIARESHLKTEQAPSYRMVGRSLASHEAVNHSIGEYVRGDA
jgi:transposase-like protein